MGPFLFFKYKICLIGHKQKINYRIFYFRLSKIQNTLYIKVFNNVIKMIKL